MGPTSAQIPICRPRKCQGVRQFCDLTSKNRTKSYLVDHCNHTVDHLTLEGPEDDGLVRYVEFGHSGCWVQLSLASAQHLQDSANVADLTIACSFDFVVQAPCDILFVVFVEVLRMQGYCVG